MRQSLIIMTLCVISPLLLTSCWWNRDSAPEPVVPVLDDHGSLDTTFARYSTGEVTEIQASLNSADFSESTKLIQKLIDDAKLSSTGGTNTGEVIDLLFAQLRNTLNQGNYEYAESESRDMANQLIATIIQLDPSYSEHPYILAAQGYAEEINKNYTGAQMLYERAIEKSESFTGTEQFQAQLLNQVGHLYGLMGDFESAFEFTYLSYKLEPHNYITSLNLARNLVYLGRVGDSIPFFEYALHTEYRPLRSEIYFSLSSLMSEKGGEVYNKEKAIEYAKASIEDNPNYPMGYYALAKIYYMDNDTQNQGVIEENLMKSLELNPNGYNSYELLGLLKLDRGQKDDAIADIKKAIEVIPKDMLLMDNQRTENTKRLQMLILLIDYLYSSRPIDDGFGMLFLSEEYGSDNVLQQLERPGNGFLGTSGEAIRKLLNQ